MASRAALAIVIRIPMSPSRCHSLAATALVVLLVAAAPGARSQSQPQAQSPPQAPNLCPTMANGRYFCPDCSTTSDRGAAFEANLLRLGDAVKAMAAGTATFLNATFAAADGDAAEDTVYGLAMCLADSEMAACSACLATAAAELSGTRCAGARAMALWYPQCLVRYATASFSGAADTSPARRFAVTNPNNFSDPTALGEARARLDRRMIAAAARAARRFAFDEEQVGANGTTLHGLAQCTEDLAPEECGRCLKAQTAWLGGCCADMDGVHLTGASCYLRYELYAFAPGTPPTMAPLLEPPPLSPAGGAGSSSSSSRKKTRIRILVGALVGAVCLFLLVGAGGWAWYRRRKNSDSSSRKRMESLLRQHHHYPRRYSYAEVKRMTRSFAHKLGQGGNGAVYKGRLPDPDGRDVAVKMLREARVDGEEFANEVASISRTSHVNVVALLGFCLEPGPKSNRAGLVYEYMPNGSLERYTVGGASGAGEERSSSPSPSLSWEQMFGVAAGIARGLEYLHRGCNAHIVHFDIKPHNILLDAGLRPKISDFGLAKLCPQRDSTISVPIAGARGTVGYIAPEVFSRQVGAAVTSKSDVYSYGMMVLEMVGARRGVVVVDASADDSGTRTGPSTASSRYFPQWLYDDLDGFCAAAAAGGEEAGAEEVVRRMVLVGLWCIRMSPKDRPTMSRVVEMLEKTTPDELQLPPIAA